MTLPNCQDLCQDFGKFPWTDFARCHWPEEQFPSHGTDHPNGKIPRGLVDYFVRQNECMLDNVRSSFSSSASPTKKTTITTTTSSQPSRATAPKGIITFSHFLPNQKVLPDWKNVESNSFLKDEWLDHGAGGISAKFAKVAGSSLLDDQIRSILPLDDSHPSIADRMDELIFANHTNNDTFQSRDFSSKSDEHYRHSEEESQSSYKHLHVFGHSHRPKDVTISNIRYIHNPLGKPAERELQMISPEVDFQLIWDCTSENGEVVAKEEIVRYWEEKGGGKEALWENMARRRKKRKEAIRMIMQE